MILGVPLYIIIINYRGSEALTRPGAQISMPPAAYPSRLRRGKFGGMIVSTELFTYQIWGFPYMGVPQKWLVYFMEKMMTGGNDPISGSQHVNRICSSHRSRQSG